MSYKCGCGLQYVSKDYIKNKTCKICREQKKFEKEIEDFGNRSTTRLYKKKIITKNRKRRPKKLKPSNWNVCVCGVKYYAFNGRRNKYCSVYCANQAKKEKAKGWSVKEEKCIACSTTKRPHRGHGFCSMCYRYYYYDVIEKKQIKRKNSKAKMNKIRSQAVIVANI